MGNIVRNLSACQGKNSILYKVFRIKKAAHNKGEANDSRTYIFSLFLVFAKQSQKQLA